MKKKKRKERNKKKKKYKEEKQRRKKDDDDDVEEKKGKYFESVVENPKGLFTVSRGGPGALIVPGSKASCAFSYSIWLPVILLCDTRMYVLLHTSLRCQGR